MSNSWEWQSTDTDKSFEAFGLYRDMGVNRSHESVANKLGKSTALISRWSRKYNWVERVRDYDKAQAEAALKDREALLKKRRDEILENETSDYELQLRKWREFVEKTKLHKRTHTETLDDGTKVKLMELNTSDWEKISRWRNDISQQGRRAVGLPERVTQNQITGNDGKPIEIETKIDDLAAVLAQLEAWEKAQRDGK